MYYLGFLKRSVKDVVLFRSTVKPKRGGLTYFVKVMGPYATEREAATEVQRLVRKYGVRENPVQRSRYKAGAYETDTFREAVELAQELAIRTGRAVHVMEKLDSMTPWHTVKTMNPLIRDNPSKISLSQIRRGTKHELEHTTDRAIARKIAMDHLKEDPRYYTHLTKMEKQYKRNPFSAEKAVGITKKLIRAYEAYRQENPGKAYHDQKFIQHMKELEKYKIGSAPYIGALAKAYEHLESAKESVR